MTDGEREIMRELNQDCEESVEMTEEEWYDYQNFLDQQFLAEREAERYNEYRLEGIKLDQQQPEDPNEDPF